ncbi:MAG TPA: cob(I)yrinic acid a,c-diamide adenosyltransferase [Bellilinea sp.]|nr:cob(I)yrinic acid a,c-diamide adenosyltransferase [Bellilinea sp.]
MKLFTGRGDQGQTDLYGEYRLEKTDPVFDMLGTLDELNEFVGSAKVLCLGKPVESILNEIQRDLYQMMALIAHRYEKEAKFAFGYEKLAFIEAAIEKLTPAFPVLKEFITPGANELSNRFGIARTITRRAERLFLRLDNAGNEKLEYAAKYLNRLSSLFFAMEVISIDSPDSLNVLERSK